MIRDREKARASHRRWLAKMTPEQLVERRRKNAECQRRYLARNPAKPLTPEQKANHLQRKRERRQALRAAASPASRLPFPGCAAPSPGRDLLMQLLALVPRGERQQDIVAAAALHVLEGHTLAEGVALGRRDVNRELSDSFQHVPLHDCWTI